jgi:hypothetical protein
MAVRLVDRTGNQTAGPKVTQSETSMEKMWEYSLGYMSELAMERRLAAMLDVQWERKKADMWVALTVDTKEDK